MEISFAEMAVIKSFSHTEKQAFYQTICGVIRMDGRVDKTETSLLSEFKRILNITDDIIIKSRLLSLDEIINILKAMSDVKKIVLLKYMAKMALVDGQITREEDYGVLHIAKLIDAPEGYY